MRHGRIGFGLMDKSQHSRPDNIIDDVLFINIFHVTMLIHDSNSRYNSSSTKHMV